MKYEYKILSLKVKGIIFRDVQLEDLNSQFNDLGKQGWEFVESQRIDTNEFTDKLLFIFRKSVS